MDELKDIAGYQRITHGVSGEFPIRMMLDLWERPGPGMRDMHFEVELGIVCAGRMTREFGGIELELKPGSLWLHGMWEPHSAYVAKAPLELLVLHLYPPFLSNLGFREAPGLNWLSPFTAPAADRPHGHPLPRKIILERVEELRLLDGNGSEYGRLKLRLLVLEFLLEIIEAWGGESRFRKSASQSPSRLEIALELVFSRKDFVGAEDAAKACGMSRNGFNRFFQSAMGIGFSQFALHHRLGCAAAELLESGKPVKAVAAEWGFTDTSHFYRRFGETYGCTPVDYRKIKLGKE